MNLRIYFWIDSSKFNGLKVRSAIVRMTKNAFEEAGISMPDEAREVVFPQGIPVHLLREKQASGVQGQRDSAQPKANEPDVVAAEGSLRSEAETVQQQARNARIPEEGKNLLAPQ